MTDGIQCVNCGSEMSATTSFCGSCGAAAVQKDGESEIGISGGVRHEELGKESIGLRKISSGSTITIRKVGILSVARVSLVVGGLGGLVLGLVYGVVMLTFDGPGTALIAVVVSPILYGFFSFAGGLLYAWLYNRASIWIGGIDVELG